MEIVWVSPIWGEIFTLMSVTKEIPLVNALCAGILRHEDIQKGAATGVGNPVYYVGPGTGSGRIGWCEFCIP